MGVGGVGRGASRRRRVRPGHSNCAVLVVMFGINMARLMPIVILDTNEVDDYDTVSGYCLAPRETVLNSHFYVSKE